MSSVSLFLPQAEKIIDKYFNPSTRNLEFIIIKILQCDRDLKQLNKLKMTLQHIEFSTEVHKLDLSIISMCE